MSDVDSVLSLLFGKRRRVKKRSAKKSSFGKKKSKFGRKSTKKPAKKAKKVPLALRRKCKKCGIKLTVKRGSKRVPKSEKLLKKQLAKKLKMMKKKKAAAKKKKVRKSKLGKRRRKRRKAVKKTVKRRRKKTVKRRRRRRSGYGASKGRSSLGMGPYPGSLMMKTPYFEMMKKA
tara:strand:+ start:542 stop:1063 length:522 start_codon:yes stop_codon:yes gene_type:complete